MSTPWLQRKRKGELLELAQQAGLSDADRYLKDDLVQALNEHLEDHEATFANKPAFADFYARRTSSPVKRERASPRPVEVVVTRPRRRQTTKSADLEEPSSTPEKALVARSPHTATRVSSLRAPQLDIPASPSQLADVAEQSILAAKAKATELFEEAKIQKTITAIRENASSVVFIQLAILLIEAVGLEWNTLKTITWDSPPVGDFLASKAVALPNLGKLTTYGFWAPALLWSVTNWGLPLLFSYFFNLTQRSNTHQKTNSRQYTVDPLTFNITRALLAYIAYSGPGVGSRFGPFASATVLTVKENVPGEYHGLQIGSLIGILVSLYDATLKK